MYTKQHTIKKEVSISGIGLHYGHATKVTLKPAKSNHGIVFQRIDLEGKPTIKADVDNVSSVARGTSLSENGGTVHTVEHLLAACAGKQIDNLLIEVDGDEIPILDGSAMPFLLAINSVGLKEQDADREFFVVEEPIQMKIDDKFIDMAALPLEDDFRVTVMIDYNSPVVGSQHATLLGIEEFENEIADCRTFCFLREVEELLSQGLIKGGDLDSALVIVDEELPDDKLNELKQKFDITNVILPKEGILNGENLRAQNEPARHKLLDLVGDLMLVGAPIKAQILAARPGHAANVQFAKQIKSKLKQKKIANKFQKNKKAGVVFDANAIQKILPHRYPFLLIDRVTNFTEKSIAGYKNLTMNEEFFQGHFPENPIMPGVLQLEAMAQIGGILLLNTIENPKDVWVYFLAIDKARFKKPVIPGDKLEFELEMLSLKRNICKMKGRATVEGNLVCEAELVASVVKK